MRLKQGGRRQENMPQEEQQCLLKNQTVNRQYEENALWNRTNARPTALSNATRVQQVWTGQQLFRCQHSPSSNTLTNCNSNKTTLINNECVNGNAKSPGRDSALASPQEEDLRAMSLSSPEDSYPSASNGVGEDDSLSDLDYNESCPLLCQDLSAEDGSSEEESNVKRHSTRQNRNRRRRHAHEEDCEDEEEEVESEDSVFSDSSCDMSDSKDNILTVENITFKNNNNINNPLTTTNNKITTVLTNHTANRNFFRGTSRVDQVFTETVQPLLQTVTSRPAAPARVSLKTDVSEAARVLALKTPCRMSRNVSDQERSPVTSPTTKLKLTLDIGKPSDQVVNANEDEPCSPMSESSSSSDVDINMASDVVINKISNRVSKENELQRFLQENNVAQDDSKILNTEDTMSLQDELRMAAGSATEEMEDQFMLSLNGIENDVDETEECSDKEIVVGKTFEQVETDDKVVEEVKDVVETFQVSQTPEDVDKASITSIEKEDDTDATEVPEMETQKISETVVNEIFSPEDEKNKEIQQNVELQVNDNSIKTPQKQAVIKPYRFENEDCPELKNATDKPKETEKRISDEENVKNSVNSVKTVSQSTNTTDANTINNNHRKDISVQISANKETSDVALSPVAALNPKFPDETHLTPSSRRRSAKNKKNSSSRFSQKTLNGDFDVYNIETAMPTIDWAAMEEHLTRAAKENDWLRRNDREEIRRKLAMDSDSEEYYCGERVTRKPSLTTRLQSGMNLQICFMNETASDLDSQGSDQDSENGNHTPHRGSPCEKRISSFMDAQKPQKNFFTDYKRQNGQTVPNYSPKPLLQDNKSNGNSLSRESSSSNKQQEQTKRQRPSFFFSRQKSWRLGQLKSSQKKEESPVNHKTEKRISPEEDFLTRHARLQAEARHALSQAKEMARMQMEVERQRKKKSPIADIVGISFPDGRHRLSRQILTDMNVAQLQVIVNDLHSQIESLNEDLVRLLLERDDLNMEQDSMLVDIEDMTRFLGAKEEAIKSHPKLTGMK